MGEQSSYAKAVAEFMARADRALESAKVLLGACDGDGAVELCSLAMFHAVRGALVSHGYVTEARKTRKQIVDLFEKRMVRDLRLEGADIKRLKNAERASDRSMEALPFGHCSVDQASRVVSDATAFLAAVRCAAPKLPTLNGNADKTWSAERGVEAIVAETQVFLDTLRGIVGRLADVNKNEVTK